jgi:hypothetical protein
MKLAIKSLVLGLAFCIAGSATAKDYKTMQGKYNWCLGLGTFAMYAEPYGDFANILNRTRLGTSIYVATRFNNPFGIELGYNWTERKSRPYYAATGTQAFGTTASASATHYAKIRLKDTYIDAHGHLRLMKNVEAKLALGIGFVRQGIAFWNEPTNNDSMSQTLMGLAGRTAITARAGIGAQAMVLPRVGVRFMVMYETMSHIKVQNMPITASPRMLKNAVTGYLSIYWTLTALNEKAMKGYKPY